MSDPILKIKMSRKIFHLENFVDTKRQSQESVHKQVLFMPDFEYIQKQEDLDGAYSVLKNARIMGMDTESSGFYTYFPEVCLIQISADERHYVIDTLSGLNLDCLGALCKDDGISKIFHSSLSDILELKRCYQWEFSSIEDTFLAAKMLGFASCSLSGLVSRLEDVKLQKKEQKSNWMQRPLTSSQLNYAHLDTVYLASLMEKLRLMLQEYDMYEELVEEFKRICCVQAPVTPSDTSENWKSLHGLKHLSPSSRAVAKNLCILREKRARKENIAPFRLLRNDVIIQLSRESSSKLDRYPLRKYFHPSFLKQDEEEILRILGQKGQGEVVQNHELYFSVKSSEKTDKHLIQKLKKWRKRIAEYRGMDPSMIISSQSMDQIVQYEPQTIDDFNSKNFLSSIKNRLYGREIIDIVTHGKDGRIPEGLSRLPQVANAV